jgi:LysR family glycine cleavage system transcriptional activator
MNRKIPPLNALRAFEAVSRLVSFTKAAEELCVTQGAVSRQISNLEAWLGLKLFSRGRHTIELTPQGQSYFAAMRDIFDEVDRSTRQLMPRKDDRLLRIKLPPTFAIRWLMPRLARFHAKHPDTEVQITTSHQRVNFKTEDIDISIHSELAPPQLPGFKLLFEETLIPVCSPGLLKGSKPLKQPDDLMFHDRLCSMNRPHDWSTWLKAAKVESIDAHEGLKFENAALAYQAATNGLGVMMGLMAFVQGDLASGLLAAPFDLSVATKGGYYISFSDSKEKTQKIVEFENWLLQEISPTP